MSDLYSIQSSTLVDIGDALRRRHGETKIITVKDDKPLKIISKTDNATGFDSRNGDYDVRLDTYDVVKIPGAVRIDVKLGCQTENTKYDYLQVATGELNSANFPTTAEKYGGKEIQSLELTFNTDVITFHFVSDTSNGAFLGYYAECAGYDADGNAIFGDVEKEVFNGYSSAEMAEAIDTIPTGLFPPDDVLHLTGNCSNKFKGGTFDWLVEQAGSQIDTYDLTNTENMFYDSKLQRIPFALNYKNIENNSCSQTFNGASYLKELPEINLRMANMHNFLYGCFHIREIPESWATTMKATDINNSNTWYKCRLQGFFDGCYSLRTIPEAFLKNLWNKCDAGANSTGQMFQYCYVLDEIVGLRNPNATLTSDTFKDYFVSCYRLKRLVFDMENGSPRTENWQNQIIDLSKNVGYSTSGSKVMITDFNAGITADKEVYDDATYQALKNDADWYSADVAYSRYNHNSAVETINSLPDCSAYLVSSSGTANIIKFKGEAGSATDGGAINTLTEEEIAVATAKGWTVSLV